MQKSRIILIIVIAAFVIAAFVAIIYNSMDLQAFTVESCITYNGRTGCGIAAGTTREEALGSVTLDLAHQIVRDHRLLGVVQRHDRKHRVQPHGARLHPLDR